ncbi:hypothetical protein ASG61_27015 [Bacillus sp. Leaf75]|nr:hypothetical protein ASG61_27015 [Bacillus sp. Leaf75]
MGVLSTGPIENNSIDGIRPTQRVTIKIINRDPSNSSDVLIQGYFLNGFRTLYVLELFTLGPSEISTKDFFANFDAFEFVFTTSGPAEERTEISVWGKSESGELISSQRLVSEEQLGR